MDNLLAVGLSHQTAMRRRMDVVANNIANMDTTAYRGETVTFRDHLFEMDGEAKRAIRPIAQVLDFGTIRDLAEGAIESTDNPLDIALTGRGFLAVETEAGETLYTRNGRLRRDGEGALVTANGQRVLDEDDRPIFLTDADTGLAIDETGAIESRAGFVGQLKLVAFADEQLMERRGDTLFATEQPEEAPQALRVIQGTVEGSNVNAIAEVTEMISVLRSYQSMQKSLDSYAELRDRAVERLPRIQG